MQAGSPYQQDLDALDAQSDLRDAMLGATITNVSLSSEELRLAYAEPSGDVHVLVVPRAASTVSVGPAAVLGTIAAVAVDTVPASVAP